MSDKFHAKSIFLSEFTQAGGGHYMLPPPGHDQTKIPGAGRVKSILT